MVEETESLARAGRLELSGRGDVISRRSVLSGAAVAAGLAAAPAYAAQKSPSAITELGLVDLSRAIRAREVSCLEVMRGYLGRIEAINPRVNAIVSLRPARELLAEAEAADRRLAAGEAVGALHGVPQAIKDLVDVAGMRGTRGSPLYKDHIARTDSPYVAKIRGAGAIIVGMTNVPEFGLGSHTFNPIFGATLNPYDLTKSAGGSSGGGAVAVATRMLPAADGSDHAGSLRNPAAWNNIYGFRTSYGRVAVTGGFYTSLSVNGTMGRTPADVGRLLSVMSGYDARAPLAIDEDPQVFAGDLRRDFAGARIGWLGDFGGAVPYEPGVLDVCTSAFAAFEQLGCRIAPALPDYKVEDAWQAWTILRALETGPSLVEHYDDPARRPLLKPEAQFEVEAMKRLTAYDVSRAMAGRNAWYRAVAALFEQFDFLIAPGAQVFPFDAKLRWPEQIAGRQMRSYHEWMQGLVLITMAGLPSLCAPAGFGPGGLPMGLQIIGRRNRDLDCLQLAAAYHAVTDWPRRRPPPLRPLRSA